MHLNPGQYRIRTRHEDNISAAILPTVVRPILGVRELPSQNAAAALVLTL